MKQAVLIIALMAIMGLLSLTVVNTPKEETGDEEGEKLSRTLEIDLKKKIYDYAYDDYQALLDHYPEDTGIMEDYRKFCLEHNYTGTYVELTKKLIKLTPGDPKLPNELGQYYYNTQNPAIYDLIKEQRELLSAEDFSKLGSIYEDIRGNYRSSTVELSEVSDWGNGYAFGINSAGVPCIIDTSCKTIYKSTKSDILSYSPQGGYAAVTDEEQLVYENIYGNRRIVPFDTDKMELLYYKYLGTFTDGIANISDDKGVWGYMNTQGVTGRLEYEYTSSFSDNVSAAKKDGKWGFISEDTLDPIGGFDYDGIYIDTYGCPSSNGFAYVKPSGEDKWALASVDTMVSEEGTYMSVSIIGSERFDDVKPFGEGAGAVKTGGVWRFIGADGEFLSDKSFDDALSYFKDRAAVCVSERWGYIDREGKFIISPQFDEATSFNNTGHALVRLGEVWLNIQLEEDYYFNERK